MKKKLLSVVVVTVVAMVAGYNVYIANKQPEMSDLILTNLEALALPGDEI